jgi:hypothetical protein
MYLTNLLEVNKYIFKNYPLPVIVLLIFLKNLYKSVTSKGHICIYIYKIGNVRKTNIVARSPNHCCPKNQ